MKRRTLLGLLVVSLGFCAASSQPVAAREPDNRDRAREIAGWDLVGQRMVRSEYSGKWTLVHFWAAW